LKFGEFLEQKLKINSNSIGSYKNKFNKLLFLIVKDLRDSRTF